jgi:glutathionyl-hydroquinone reductase
MSSKNNLNSNIADNNIPKHHQHKASSQQYAPPNTGSNPPKWKYNNTLPVPWWFNPHSVSKFHSLPLHSSDIVVSSGIKMGTTWMNKILISLLYEYDTDGIIIPKAIQQRHEIPGRLGQTYPEALYPTREECVEDILGIFDRVPNGREGLKALMGNFVLDDLVNGQPEPRIFVTHLFGKEFLPLELFHDGSNDNDDNNNNGTPLPTATTTTTKQGKGKLIVVLRNLKDAMCSLHNFRGLPVDGWFGNEHGPGTFARYLMLNNTCPNALGSAFDWIRQNNDAVMSIGPERALVVYYESLILDFGGQLRRINDFLELGKLTPAKAKAIEEACALESMKHAASVDGARYSWTARVGGIGKWTKAPLSMEQWMEFDRVFNIVLGDAEIADPLRFFQYESVPGLPELALEDCDLDTDPRKWEPYLLVMLRGGMIVPDPYFRLLGGCVGKKEDERGNSMEFKYNKPRLLLSESNSDGSPRYHLFVAESSPLASAVSASRTLLGLENMISMDVADGESGGGLVFLNGCSCAPWKGSEGPFWLYSVYQLSDPSATTRITAPVLWDTVEQRIVTNDAWEILKLMSREAEQSDLIIFNDALGAILKEGLFSSENMESIESMYLDLSSTVFNVEAVGIEIMTKHGKDIIGVNDEVQKIFTKLRELNDLLGKRRFLLGNNLTAVDIVLAMFLFRFDACYTPLFNLSNHEEYVGTILMGNLYPNLKAYSRELYQELKSTLKIQGFRQIFRLPHAITFTREAYSTTAGVDYDLLTGNESIPDLNQIVASLEEPATDRPKGTPAHAANSVPKLVRDGVAMPMWFRDDTVQLYRDLDLRDDDIILSSGVKMGTTWVTKILNSLLYDFDDDGKTTSAYMDDSFPNRLGQTYPDALFPSREVEKHEMATKDEEFVKRMKMLKTNFGDFVFDDLLNQPSPRLFSSHLSGKNLLPKKLFDGWKDGGDNGDTNGDNGGAINKGKGRLIVVIRNLKDTLVSLHHFRGVPKDGWYGNEHGPGSFARAIDLENCPNAFGNSFLWVKRSAEAVDAIGPERALVLQYEELKLDFDTQLERINDFLGLPKLTEAKAMAVAMECAAKSMKEKTGGRFKMIIRKGMVGDWQNYLDDERWEEFDRIFDKVLGGVDIAEKLRKYQCKEGLDEIIAAQEA